MYLLSVLISIILVIVILFIIFPLKIIFTLNSEELLNFNLKFSWLSPIFKAVIESENEGIVLKAYVFQNDILKKKLKFQNSVSNKNNTVDFIRHLRPTYIKLQTSYGFKDPSITGVIYGVVNLVSEYINLDSLHNNPNFNASGTYFNINAQVNVNIASMLINYIRYSTKNNSKEPLYGSR